MADATVDAPVEGKKSSKMPLIIGAVLAVLGGAGGFFVVQMNPLGLFGGADKAHATEEGKDSVYHDPTPLGDVGFVEVPPIVISLGPTADGRTLRFRTSLEVPAQHATAVTAIVPRVQDVLNSYLRALEPTDFEAPGALIRLRSQLLRRVKLVAGDDHVRDLLVLEFIVN
ncbi:flagellar basal body-associated FliL family protein [Citreimonas salinaria]|uniref:Flagellar protein FliL n=1 Tax=Citreimonas salinaria TaxID=321339 RepID=A0A1H3F7J8_9RHOB|nr:flagellar basal body-associated FliL family protein [Citreimonas salinaria]SDX86817.1 flagellar FliL protein [Citreimonas salinaria]